MLGVWDTWKELTQFLESGSFALARERQLWSSIEIPDRLNAKIVAADGVRQYNVTVEQHLAAVTNERALHSAVLVFSYSLAEAAARDKLGLAPDDVLQNGIESWGQGMLSANAQSWASVQDGLAGAVEAAIVRNAVAHGTPTVESRMLNRLEAAGSAVAWKVGDPVVLGYLELQTYRARLKSLMRVSGV